MQPMFTIHIGEFLVGEYINRKLGKEFEVWVPTKDTGVDLLLTRKKSLGKVVRLQAKFSRGFGLSKRELEAFGWFTLNPKKILASAADFWVFVILPPSRKPSFIVVPIEELKKRIPGDCHGTWHLYLKVTKEGKCFNTRGLPREEANQLMRGRVDRPLQDFSLFVNKRGFQNVMGHYH